MGDIFSEFDEIIDENCILPNYPIIMQKYKNSCGPAVVMPVLKYYFDIDYTEETIGTLLCTEPYPKGTNIEAIAKFFRSIDVHVRVNTEEMFANAEDFVSFVIETLKNNSPILIEDLDKEGHWIVIIGYQNDKIICLDPMKGIVEQDYALFFENWTYPKNPYNSSIKQPFITIKSIGLNAFLNFGDLVQQKS